jgi:hypothetical protein
VVDTPSAVIGGRIPSQRRLKPASEVGSRFPTEPPNPGWSRSGSPYPAAARPQAFRLLSSSISRCSAFFGVRGTPGFSFAATKAFGCGGPTQKTTLRTFLAVTVDAERDDVVEIESASTFCKPVDVVGLDLLRAPALPTAIAVSTLGYLSDLLPRARAPSLHGCALGAALPAPLPLVGTPALRAWPPSPRLRSPRASDCSSSHA